MDAIHLLRAIVLVITFSIISLNECNCIPLQSNCSHGDEKTAQEDVDLLHSSSLNINLAVEPNSILFNLEKLTPNGNISISKDFNGDMNTSTTKNLESESPIVARSIKNQSDDISTKLETIETLLKNLRTENKEFNANIEKKIADLKKKSVGVQCSSCDNHMKDQTNHPANCKEVQRQGNRATGIYRIFPKHAKTSFPVLCDMDIRGGGWTHIQKRFDGSQDFFLGWRDYKFGFGDLDGEFWLGLQQIYILTGFESAELLVEIVDRSNVSAYAHYTSFGIGPEPEGYKLVRLSGYSGDAGDSLDYHHNQKFSTKDLDFSGCATKFVGAWWYNECTRSNLNGKYINIDLPSKHRYEGLHWDSYRGAEYSHSQSRMLIRPVN